MRNGSVILVLVAFVLLSPVLVPIGVAMGALDRRRLKAAVRDFVCLNCGSVLGTISLELAEDAQRSETRELLRRWSGGRLRIVKTYSAICPSCGARYAFDRHVRAMRQADSGR